MTIPEILDQLADILETSVDNIDRSIDPEKVESYLTTIEDPIVKDIIQQIIRRTVYINFSTFIHEMRSIAEKISIDEFSIYLDINDPTHSEFWCLVIIWPIIKERVAKIFTAIDQMTNEFPILIVDDCIYSGLRMGDLIRTINNTISGKIHVYICVPFTTSTLFYVVAGANSGRFQIV